MATIENGIPLRLQRWIRKKRDQNFFYLDNRGKNPVGTG